MDTEMMPIRLLLLVTHLFISPAIFADTTAFDPGASGDQHDAVETEREKPTVGNMLLTFEDLQKFLLPIAMRPISGAYGSQWKTEFLVHNANDSEVFLAPQWPGCSITCSQNIRSQSTAVPTLAFKEVGQNPGLFVFVPKEFAAGLTFNLRVQDVSRQAQTWGTEIPVISEKELFTGPIQLLNVPNGSGFRVLLRIYDFDGLGDAEVEVRGYRLFFCCETASGLLGKTIVRLQGGTTRDPYYGGLILEPAYAQLSQFGELWGFSSDEPMRIEIIPLTSGLRFWAFVTVTNNETQHVTTITQQ